MKVIKKENNKLLFKQIKRRKIFRTSKNRRRRQRQMKIFMDKTKNKRK